MGIKKALRLMLMGAFLVVPYVFNSCAPVPMDGNYSSSLSACDSAAMTAFKPYYQVLHNKCSSCHKSGGVGNGAFADDNIWTAFGVFKLKTEAKIYGHAISTGHKPPATGTQNIAALQEPQTIWNAGLASYNACKAAAASGGGPAPTPGAPLPAQPSNYPMPSILTTAKTATLVAGAAATRIVWQLGSEMAVADSRLAGASLTISVAGFAGVNSPYIVISDLNLRAGTTSLYSRNLGIQLGGAIVPAPAGVTFQTAQRYVPVNATRPIMNGGGAMIVEVASLTNLQIAVAFEKIEPATLEGVPIVFDPPTFTQLTSTNAPALKRVFAAKCTTCHNATVKRGDLDLTNYTSAMTVVNPNSLEGSTLYQRIRDNSMPPGGLPQNEKDSVTMWLLDGAPR